MKHKIVIIAAVMFLSAALKAHSTTSSENFSSGLGQFSTLVGNTVGGNHFGHSATSLAAGVTGELGGVFSRSGGGGAYAADTDLGGNLSLATPLSFSGKLYLDNGNPSANFFDGSLFIGYFNSASGLVSGSQDLIGMEIRENEGPGSDTAPFRLYLHVGSATSELLISLTQDVPHTFSLSWDGTTLSGSVGATPLSFTPSAQSGQVNSFGVGAGIVGSSNANQTTQFYVDDLTYTIVTPAALTFWELADQRINQHRKNDINVTVVDAQGNPIAAAPVRVKMTRHSFGFGTAVSEKFFWDVDPNSPYVDEDQNANAENSAFYRQNILGLFNQITLENGLKWHKWEDSTRKPKALGLLEWAYQNKHRVRAHTLVWGRDEWDTVPPDVSNNRNNAAYVNNRINGHINDISNHPLIKGKIVDWDVVNEPINETALTTLLNPGFAPKDAPKLKDWFDRAQSADPNAKRYINEFEILVGDNSPAVRSNYYDMIQNLKTAGAPIQGIGMQGHFWQTPPSIEEIKNRYDTFAQLGLPMQITEFDMYGWGDETQKANFMRDFLRLTFSIPAMEAFTMWGFWDAKHWKNSAPIYFADKTIKPSGQEYINLVFNTWWTDQSGPSLSNGVFARRGFLGNYDLIVTYNGVQYLKKVTLNRGNGAGNFTLVAGISTLYDTWASSRFTQEELANPALETTLWGFAANPDADSHNNLLEMLFATNPKIANTSNINFTSVTNTNATLDFSRAETFPTQHVRVQWSTDLLNWSSEGVVLSSGSVSNGTVPMQAVITTIPQTQIFVRIAAGDFPTP